MRCASSRDALYVMHVADDPRGLPRMSYFWWLHSQENPDLGMSTFVETCSAPCMTIVACSTVVLTLVRESFGLTCWRPFCFLFNSFINYSSLRVLNIQFLPGSGTATMGWLSCLPIPSHLEAA